MNAWPIHAGGRRDFLFVASNVGLWLLTCLYLLSLPPVCFGEEEKPPATPEKPKISPFEQAVNFLKGKQGETIVTPSALSALALLKAGVPADTPAIQSVVQKINGQIVDDVFTPSNPQQNAYEASIALMVLANADARSYKQQIKVLADYIVQLQSTEGDWGTAERTIGDTSISQFAILALWEASRADVRPPAKTWDRAAGWHTTCQNSDGSFAHHPSKAKTSTGAQSMTVAGISSLQILRLLLYPNAKQTAASEKKATRLSFVFLESVTAGTSSEDSAADDKSSDDSSPKPKTRLTAIDKSISHGIDWLAESVTATPAGQDGLYYLFGLERVMALAGIEQINGHDWYAEGAAHLAKTQSAAGSWQDASGVDVATSFGLLFLSKPTGKMLHRATQKTRARPLAGGRGLPENLADLEVIQGKPQIRKLKGTADQFIAELENIHSRKVESAQAALVDLLLHEDRTALKGKRDRLITLATDSRTEVRRTALWCLGRTEDLLAVPTLIAALKDSEPACVIESRNALRFISKKPRAFDPPDQPTAAQVATAVEKWRKWYAGIAPYDDQDTLQDGGGK